MHTWIVRGDRNAMDLEIIQEDLVELGATIQDLQVEVIPSDQWVSDLDSAHMRDFVAIASATAPHIKILEVVAEELLAEFGFTVDFKK